VLSSHRFTIDNSAETPGVCLGVTLSQIVWVLSLKSTEKMGYAVTVFQPA
jgi:hypothetical protein